MSDTPNPFADADPQKMPLPTPAGKDNLNPYASPLTASERTREHISIWRDGQYVVAHRDAIFPKICIRTDEPAKRAYRCQLKWSYPIDFSHRYVQFDVGLCEACIRKYRRRKLIGWFLLAISVIVGILMVRLNMSVLPFVVAFFLAILGLSIVMRPAVPLKVQKVKQPYFWIRGASPAFLDRLPNAPTT